jgi:hypothetical protein
MVIGLGSCYCEVCYTTILIEPYIIFHVLLCDKILLCCIQPHNQISACYLFIFHPNFNVLFCDALSSSGYMTSDCKLIC